MLTNSMYTVRRCKKNDILYGSTHASDTAEETCCGLNVENGKWWITNNTFDGDVTCKKCIKVIKGA